MRRILMIGLLSLLAVLVILPVSLTRFLARPTPPPVVEGPDSLVIKVYFPETEEIREMPLGEYVKGVVAAEMPPEFATEALKAQFVVARTYAVRRMRQFNGPGKGGCPLNEQADVCADPLTGQAYESRQSSIERLGRVVGENFWRRLDQIQADTEGLVLTYDGQLIDPLYHSVSGSVTEDAGEYFSQDVPYLKSVDDRWAADSPKLRDQKSYTVEELVQRLSVNGDAVPVAAVASAASAGRAPVEITGWTRTGRVKTVRVGGITFSGRTFRERLGLQSTNFTVSVSGGRILIDTVGYGHGVGMSQYGADGMARAGKTAEEILQHYYQGVSLRQLFAE